MSQLTRVGGHVEQALNSGWRVWMLAGVVWLIGYVFYLLGTPVWVWGGLWAVFFLYVGSYCARNFLHCRETHCAITGPGWLILGLLALLGVVGLIHIPAWALLWVAYLLVAALGFGMQWVISRRTGRQSLGRGPDAGQMV